MADTSWFSTDEDALARSGSSWFATDTDEIPAKYDGDYRLGSGGIGSGIGGALGGLRLPPLSFTFGGSTRVNAVTPNQLSPATILIGVAVVGLILVIALRKK
jgi:hypothetical protein